MDILTQADGQKPPEPSITGPITLPRFKKAVYVRELGLGELVDVDRLSVKADGEGNQVFDNAAYNAALIIVAACDEKGNRLFTAEDIPAILKWPGRDARLVTRAALAENPLTESGIDNLSKNSPAGQ